MRARVLIVEDDGVSRALAGRILQPHYEIEFAADAQEARAKLIGGLVDLVLCDIYMPGESGLELAETVLADRGDPVGVIMVTGADDPALAARALDMGAYGYLVKPYRSSDLLNAVNSALHRQRLERQTRAYQQELEQDVISKGLETERMRQLLRRSEESLEQARLETVLKLSMAVELRDRVTGEHLSRMGGYCEEIARRIGLDDKVCEMIALAAQMHDVGKIAVSDNILLKAGPLTDQERRQMQAHAEIGRQILQGSDSPLMQLAESIAWTHHEKIDGSGYPRGLRGDEIPIEGRVAAVADVFDALTRDRPYRGAMPTGKAVSILADGKGSHFDGAILEAFMEQIPAPVAA